jgi:hypothetical protein
VNTPPVTTPPVNPPPVNPPPVTTPPVTPPSPPTVTGIITQINQDVGGLGLPQPQAPSPSTLPSFPDVAVAEKSSILIGTSPAPLP